MNEVCPCRTIDQMKVEYKECCGKKPTTAEALMRSRYTAYVRADVDYIEATQVAAGDFNKTEARDWAQNSDWLGLEIKKTTKGTENDSTGTVEFIAHYKDKKSDKEFRHHENSLFKKEKDGWKFVEGNILGAQPVKRLEEKVGRNDLCTCGSGKKFKKCCG